jgi:hypothetical protein
MPSAHPIGMSDIGDDRRRPAQPTCEVTPLRARAAEQDGAGPGLHRMKVEQMVDRIDDRAQGAGAQAFDAAFVIGKDIVVP